MNTPADDLRAALNLPPETKFPDVVAAIYALRKERDELIKGSRAVVTAGESINVELWYPSDEKQAHVVVGLMSVRSAEDIRVSFSHARDGYVIEAPIVVEMQDVGWREVAFIDAADIRTDEDGNTAQRNLNVGTLSATVELQIGPKLNTLVEKVGALASAADALADAALEVENPSERLIKALEGLAGVIDDADTFADALATSIATTAPAFGNVDDEVTPKVSPPRVEMVSTAELTEALGRQPAEGATVHLIPGHGYVEIPAGLFSDPTLGAIAPTVSPPHGFILVGEETTLPPVTRVEPKATERVEMPIPRGYPDGDSSGND